MPMPPRCLTRTAGFAERVPNELSTDRRKLWGRSMAVTEGTRSGRGSGEDTPLGIVLAGGMSRRMGHREKTLLELGGKPLLAHVLENLGRQVAEIAVNANGDPGRFRRFGLQVVDDGNEERRGPLAGVLAGMELARGRGHTRIVTVAGDTPFFPGNLVETLTMAADLQSAAIVLAASRDSGGGLRMHPTFGLWRVSLADDLARSLESGTRKILDWTDTHWTVPAEFACGDGDPFFNVNTPEDLDRAERMLTESDS